MKEIRCPKCNKLLLKADFGVFEVKCKCGKLVKKNIIPQILQNTKSHDRVI